jgi:hypothetical protein
MSGSVTFSHQSRTCFSDAQQLMKYSSCAKSTATLMRLVAIQHLFVRFYGMVAEDPNETRLPYLTLNTAST